MNKPDITDRLRGYAEVNEDLGTYTEAKCLYDAIEEIEALRAEINKMKKDLLTTQTK